jgi:hypothetical protein
MLKETLWFNTPFCALSNGPKMLFLNSLYRKRAFCRSLSLLVLFTLTLIGSFPHSFATPFEPLTLRTMAKDEFLESFDQRWAYATAQVRYEMATALSIPEVQDQLVTFSSETLWHMLEKLERQALGLGAPVRDILLQRSTTLILDLTHSDHITLSAKITQTDSNSERKSEDLTFFTPSQVRIGLHTASGKMPVSAAVGSLFKTAFQVHDWSDCTGLQEDNLLSSYPLTFEGFFPTLNMNSLAKVEVILPPNERLRVLLKSNPQFIEEELLTSIRTVLLSEVEKNTPSKELLILSSTDTQSTSLLSLLSLPPLPRVQLIFEVSLDGSIDPDLVYSWLDQNLRRYLQTNQASRHPLYADIGFTRPLGWGEKGLEQLFKLGNNEYGTKNPSGWYHLKCIFGEAVKLRSLDPHFGLDFSLNELAITHNSLSQFFIAGFPVILDAMGPYNRKLLKQIYESNESHTTVNAIIKMYLKGIDPKPEGICLLKLIEKDENKTLYSTMLKLCESLKRMQARSLLDRQLIKSILVHYADQDFINSSIGQLCFQDCLLDLLVSTRQGDGYIEEQDWLLLKPLADRLFIETLVHKTESSGLSLISALILCCPDRDLIKQYIQNILHVTNMTKDQLLNSGILRCEIHCYVARLHKCLRRLYFTVDELDQIDAGCVLQ